MKIAMSATRRVSAAETQLEKDVERVQAFLDGIDGLSQTRVQGIRPALKRFRTANVDLDSAADAVDSKKDRGLSPSGKEQAALKVAQTEAAEASAALSNLYLELMKDIQEEIHKLQGGKE